MAFRRKHLSEQHAAELMLEGAWMHDEPRRVDWAVGAALLLRRDAVLEVGPLNERYFMYAEDLDWCWRATRKGWEIWFEPSAIVRHVGNASGAKRYGDRRTKAYIANSNDFYARAHGPVGALAYRSLNVIGSAIRYVGARRSGDGALAGQMRALFVANLTARRAKRER
jgi:GT2 family glycosyltransferase